MSEKPLYLFYGRNLKNPLFSGGTGNYQGMELYEIHLIEDKSKVKE